MRRARVTVARAYKVTQGAVLKQALTSSWNDGASLAVEAATDFSPQGGEGIFEPDTNPEAFSYSGIQISASDDPTSSDYLLGVTRANPVAHAKGTFIQEGSVPTFEKQIDGYPDGKDTLVSGIPVRQTVYALLHLADYDPEDMPVVPVEMEEDGQWYVTDGPVGAAPLFDQDLEVLPAVGGGDATQGTVDDDGNVVLPPGLGYEDGESPSTGVTPIVVGGIGTLFLRFDTIANNSQVTYKAHVHTTNGFTPGETTQVGTLELAGTPDLTAVIPVKDFPAGHVLDGTATDPPKAGTTYYAVIIPSDGSGEYEGPHTQASGTPIKVATADIISGSISADLIAAGAITSTKIENGAISTPKLATGAVTAVKITAGTITANEIATGTITSDQIAANSIVGGDIAGTTITGAKIAGTTITADKLSVSSLSAISANIGTVTAGSVTGVTLTGNTILSDPTSASIRVEIQSSNAGTVEWRGSGSPGTLHARVFGDTAGQAELYGANLVSITAPGASGELLFRTAGTTKFSVNTNPTFHVRPNYDGSLTTPGSGGLEGYIQIQVDGVNKKIPYHAV